MGEGLGLFLVIIIIVAIVGIFFANQAREFLASAASYVTATGVQSSIGINPHAGQTVCDLKLTLPLTLTAQSLLGPSLSAGIGVAGGMWQIPNGAVYSWQNCHQFGNLLGMSWVPLSWITPQTSAIQPADVLVSTGQNVKINLVVVAPDGSLKSYQTDLLCLQLCTTVSIPQGLVGVPKQYTVTFLVTGIPREPYQIQITSDLPINGQNAGVAYNQQVNP